MDIFIAMRTFSEVARAGSMNAAALKLNVSGALVGQRIAGLEDYRIGGQKRNAAPIPDSEAIRGITTFAQSYRCLFTVFSCIFL